MATIRHPEAGGSPPLASFGSPFLYTLIAFLVALALLNAQVTVTRLLAYRFFYHFVFFVISMAQLGLAAAGAWVYMTQRPAWLRRDLMRCLLVLAVFPLVVLAAYAWLGPRPNLSFGKLEGPPAYAYLSILALLLVVLNFAGGMALTLLFTTFKERIGRLYAADLVGAGLGCIASVGLMMTLGPLRAFLFSGVAALLASLALTEFGRSEPAPRRRSNQALFVTAGAIAVLLGIGLLRPQTFDPNVRFPDIARKIDRTEWNHIARTDSPRQGLYVIDGDAATSLYRGGESATAPEYGIVRPEPDVAIVGVGGGYQLAVARRHGAGSVLAVDINPTILGWALNEDREFNKDLYHQPNVTVEVGEGRHVLRSSDREFDLIVMHAIDTWTASSQGAYSLSENFLYTSEAMQDLLSKLRPGGVVSIERWLFWPPRENLRLFITILDALQRLGYEAPGQHVVVLSPEPNFRDPDLKVYGLILFSNQPLSSEKLTALDAFVRNHGWAFVYRPGLNEATPFTEFAQADDKAAFLAEYPFIVKASHDSNPFFFQFALPWSQWGGTYGHRLSHAIYGTSSTMLMVCLGLAVVLTLVLLGTPLVVRRDDVRDAPQIWPAVLYFGCLGLGFMAFELPVIQVTTLYLGHPTYALSVVLLGLLISAGVGSYVMGILPIRMGETAILVVVALGVLSAAALLPAVHAFIDLPDGLRFASTLLYLAVVGVPLGMPFVAGARVLDSQHPHLVAWAWAVNGATAVVGSCVLMILMVFTDSRVALLLAAAAYAVAFLARRRLQSAGVPV